MTTETELSVSQDFADRGVTLSWVSGCCTFQIPSAEHVLFAAYLLENEPNDYCMAINNGSGYRFNCLLLAAIVGTQIHYHCRQERDKLGGGDFTHGDLDLDKAQQVVAQAIIDFLPTKAKCLLRHAFCEARKILGLHVPGQGAKRAITLQECGCEDCKREIRDPEYREYRE